MWNNATPEVVNQYGTVRAKNPLQVARGIGQINTVPLAQIDKIRTRAARSVIPGNMPMNPQLQAALMALLPQQR